jgi:hypothetical protein
VLQKSAQINDTEGYRYLVNADKFEKLDSDEKQSIARMHSKAKGRAPASLKNKK